MAEEMAAEIEELGAPVAVLGHSMGGKVAMTLALTRPDLVDRLMVVDIAPVPYRHGYSGLIRALRAAPVANAAKRSDVDRAVAEAIPDPGLRGFLLQNLERDDRGYRWRANLAGLDRAMDDILDFPVFPPGTRYEGPVSVLTGARSDYVRPDGEAAIRTLFPKARILRIPEAGHWLHAERPDAVIDAVRDLLT
jgi:pimeloyl-ACP methyl ester carboxylesterase